MITSSYNGYTLPTRLDLITVFGMPGGTGFLREGNTL
jgi:hypothetical protein